MPADLGERWARTKAATDTPLSPDGAHYITGVIYLADWVVSAAQLIMFAIVAASRVLSVAASVGGCPEQSPERMVDVCGR